jgi:hypothetical protein
MMSAIAGWGSGGEDFYRWWRLLRSSTLEARLELANSEDTLSFVLELLCSDESEEVALRAVLNPGLQPENLRRLAAHSSLEVRSGVCLHKNTPEDALHDLLDDPLLAGAVLDRLAKSERAQDRKRAASDERLAREVLFELAGDGDSEVAAVAAATLARIDGLLVDDSIDSLLDLSKPMNEAEPAGNTASVSGEWSEPEGAAPIEADCRSTEEFSPEPGLPRADEISLKPAEAQPEEAGPAFELDDLPYWDDDELRDEDDLLDLIEAIDATEALETPLDDSFDTTQRAHYWAEQIMYREGWSSGHDVLVRALDRPAIGQIAKAIVREIRKGMVPEELELALELREHWEGHYAEIAGGAISWPETLKLIRGFEGYPDPVELYAFLADAYQEFKWGPSRRLFRNFGVYVWHLLVDDWGGSNGPFNEHRFRLGRWVGC